MSLASPRAASAHRRAADLQRGPGWPPPLRGLRLRKPSQFSREASRLFGAFRTTPPARALYRLRGAATTATSSGKRRDVPSSPRVPDLRNRTPRHDLSPAPVPARSSAATDSESPAAIGLCPSSFSRTTLAGGRPKVFQYGQHLDSPMLRGLAAHRGGRRRPARPELCLSAFGPPAVLQIERRAFAEQWPMGLRDAGQPSYPRSLHRRTRSSAGADR